MADAAQHTSPSVCCCLLCTGCNLRLQLSLDCLSCTVSALCYQPFCQLLHRHVHSLYTGAVRTVFTSLAPSSVNWWFSGNPDKWAPATAN
jgi:hypothetical protein